MAGEPPQLPAPSPGGSRASPTRRAEHPRGVFSVRDKIKTHQSSCRNAQLVSSGPWDCSQALRSLPRLPWGLHPPCHRPSQPLQLWWGLWCLLEQCCPCASASLPRWFSGPCCRCRHLVPVSLGWTLDLPISAPGLGLLTDLCPAAGSAGGLWGGQGHPPSWGSLVLQHLGKQGLESCKVSP